MISEEVMTLDHLSDYILKHLEIVDSVDFIYFSQIAILFFM